MASDGTLLFDTKVDEKGINDGLKSIGESSEKSGGVMKTVFTNGLAVLSGNLMTKAIEGLGQIATKSIEVGASFEQAMAQVGATLGYSVEDLNNPMSEASQNMAMLTEKAEEMGRTTKFTATESAEALNILAMSGFSAQESIGMVDTVLNLAAAGSLDMASAATYVGGAMKGFGDKTKTAQYYADLMAKGATKANTNVNMLGTALSDASSTAAGYGQSAEDVTLALLELAEQNVTGSEAATMLNRTMADLYTPTDNAASALEELGVSAYDSTGKAKDFNDLVRELEGALEGMSEEQKNAYLNTIFTTNGLQGFNKITATTVEKEKEFASALADANGAAAQQAETMGNTLQGKVTELGSAFDGLLIATYNWIKEPLTEGVEFVTGIINGITELIAPQKDAMEQFLDDVKEMNNQAREAGEQADKVMESATYDVAKFEAYKTELQRLLKAENDDYYAKWRIKQIVGELEGDIPELADAYDDEKESLSLTNDELERMFSNKEALIMQSAFEEARTLAIKEYNDAVIASSMAESAQAQLLDEIAEKLGVESITYEEANEQLLHNTELTSDQFKLLSDNINKYASYNDEVAESAKLVEQANQKVEDINRAQEFYNQTIEQGTEKTNESNEATSDLTDKLGEAKNFIDNVAQAIDNHSGSLIDMFKNVVAEANEAAEREADDSNYIGENLIYGISDGVIAAAGSLVSAAVSAVADAWYAMCDWLDIASPSKKAKTWIGGNWAKGISLGFSETMEDESPEMTGAIADTFGQMKTAVNDIESGNIAGGFVSPLARVSGASGEFNYEVFAKIIADALKNVAVNIDGQKAGDLLTDYIDQNLGQAKNYSQGGVW